MLKLIFKEFSLTTTVKFFICTREELINETIEKLKEENYLKTEIEYAKNYLLPKINEKYFPKLYQIWLVDVEGINLDLIIHEALHSIQKCEENQEAIVDYITYKLTGNKLYINDYVLLDWQEIEKTFSWKKIKRRLVLEGNCEDF
jgi:hypothetical protein